MFKLIVNFSKLIKSPTYYFQRFYFRNIRVQFPGMNKDGLSKRINSWGAGKAKRIHISNIGTIKKVESISILNPLNKLQDMSLDLYETVVINLFAASLGKNTKILEIGTFDGNTTINLSENAKQASRVYSVDLPDDLVEFELRVRQGENNHRQKTIIKSSQISTKNLRSISLVKQDSATIDFSKKFGKVDMCFIDGNHSFSYVESDTLNCYSILKSGGTIVWHDYGYIYSVTKFIDSWSKANNLKIEVVEGTRLAFLRKD